MKKYEYILFDLDGTLVYSHPGIFAGIRHALREMGRDEGMATEETLRKCVGPSLVYSFTHFFGMNEEDAKQATAIYRAQYSKTGLYKSAPIEGAIEALKALKEKGYVLAMATSKPGVFAEKIAEYFDFAKYFTVLVGCGLDGSLPTKADVIEEVVRRLGAEKEKCLMVGDRKHDVEGAKIAGVDCVLLNVGYAEAGEADLCQPTYEWQDYAELLAKLG